MIHRMNAPRISSLRFALAFLCFCLSLAAIPAQAATPQNSEAMRVARQLNEAFVHIAETVSPSVVVIEVLPKSRAPEVDAQSPFFEMFPELRRHFEEFMERHRRQQEEAPQNPRRAPQPRREFSGRGSGVVLREDGYILTNSHVVSDSEEIRVRLRDGRTFTAENFWTDAQSDIAVIKIAASGLPAARLGDSAKVRVGEFAIAIGAPFFLDYSVTFGHVSAKGRSQIVPGEMGRSMDQDFIQTDASINPGNSGGPLVNIDGEVIGINTMIRGINTGIGFAVPVNLAKTVSQGLIQEGRFVRAWLGIGTAPIELSRMRDLLSGVESGVVVETIIQNGPAAKSDLKPADVITAIQGNPVRTINELRSEVRAHPVGTELEIDIVRGGKPMQVKVKTEPWQETAPTAATRPERRPEPREIAGGVTVRALNAELAQQYQLETREGVIVTAVEPESLGAVAEFQEGDIITDVNHTPVKAPRDFTRAMEAALAAKKPFVINVVRRGAPTYLIVPVEVE
jgi:serine protease Do